LSIAGLKVVHQDTGYDDLILARGKLFKPSPKKVRLLDGAPNRCHLNATGFYIMYQPFLTLVTGYGLSKDGLWRRHSWLTAKRADIWETTIERDLYFGVKLDGEETVRFVLRDIASCLPALDAVKDKMEQDNQQ
jgi:hypothetical protein